MLLLRRVKNWRHTGDTGSLGGSRAKKNTPAVAAPGNLGEFTSHGVKQKRRDFCYTHCGPSVWLTVCVERLANCLNFTKLGQTKNWTCWIWPNILKQTPTATTHRTNICVCRSLFDRCAIGFNNTQQTSHLFPLMYSFQMKAELSDIKEVCNWKWEQLSFLQQCSLMSSSYKSAAWIKRWHNCNSCIEF